MLLISIVFDVDSSAYRFEETCMICIDWLALIIRKAPFDDFSHTLPEITDTFTALLQINFLGT